MTERPGPQSHNAGVTLGYRPPKPIPQRISELEAAVERLKDICEAQAVRLDVLERENRRLRAELGAAAK